jgi:hypothetical protein
VNEHEISRLSDLLQLQALKAAYCETVDACVKAGAAATARFGELFTEDVRADYGMGPLIVRMRRKGSATSDELFGRYLDEFRRTPNGWRISSVRFIQEG